MASDLKLCPFCGKPPKIRRNRNDGLYIFCSFDGCDIQPAIEAFGPEKDEEIVDSWNQRVPNAGLVEALKWTRDQIAQVPFTKSLEEEIFRHTRAALRAVGVSHE